MLFAATYLEMPNYIYVLSLHVNFAARKSSVKESHRVADNIMQRPLCKNREIFESFLEKKIELIPIFPLI